MPDTRNSLYYEMMDLRNRALSRDIGKYRAYTESLIANGGEAIGEGYEVADVDKFLRPTPLSERSQDDPGAEYSTLKPIRSEAVYGVRQGGLFGYTHEVTNGPKDPLSRNREILQTYFDNPSTASLFGRLDRIPSVQPWGETGGLRVYSSIPVSDEIKYFGDYRDYMTGLFMTGLSFQRPLGEGYIERLLSMDYTDENMVKDSIETFIRGRSGFITDSTDVALMLDDTKLGYIGRIEVAKEKARQISQDGKRGVSTRRELPERPGLSDNLFGAPNARLTADPLLVQDDIFHDRRPTYPRYIRDMKEVIGDITDITDTNRSLMNRGTQHTILTGHILRNHKRGWYSQYQEYTSYISVTDVFHTIESITLSDGRVQDKTIMGEEETNDIGLSVEGYFNNAGVYDRAFHSSQHYDEQDGINEGERNRVASAEKSAYGETTEDRRINTPDFLGMGVGVDRFSDGDNSLLSKTKELFRTHKIKTLIGRFHTSSDDDSAKEESLTQTATDPTYGISHGRNLLKTGGPDYRENGYENPYCRVWTYHHQYSQLTDLIRPFSDDGTFQNLETLQKSLNGRAKSHLNKYESKTVLNRNGMVNVTPIGRASKDKRVKAKQCMLSIENLAWKSIKKDSDTIDAGEVGPLGGRIMWFPPYNLTFNESVNVNWGQNDFIGRGESIYSYTNTSRSGSISFTILADHPSIVDYWMNTDGKRNAGGGTLENQDTILRFYAGCETISGTSEASVFNDVFPDGKKAEANPAPPKDNPKPETPTDKTDPEPQDNTNETPEKGPQPEFDKDNSISFYMFFPNNLSGIDFVNEPDVIIKYLIEGKNGFNFTITDEGKKVLNKDEVRADGWNGDGYEMGRSGGTGLTDNETREKVSEYNLKPANDKGRNYLWGYGIDEDKVKERLCGPNGPKGESPTYKLYADNYSDSSDYGLNVTPGDDTCDYSFADVAVALSTTSDYSGKGEDPAKVEKIKEILGISPDKVRTTGRKYYFSIAGGASVHGVVDRNVGLSTRRAAFLTSWLDDCFKKLNLQVDYDKNAEIKTFTEISGGQEDLFVNSKGAKRGRYAKAVIYWEDDKVVDATETKKEYKEGEEQPDAVIIQETVLPKGRPEEEKNEEAATAARTNLNTVTTTPSSDDRYRDEEMFFSLLEEKDLALYKNIVDKIKYFDPVYHSITPEGFNRRLAFLHQCTRQGPTLSSSDVTKLDGVNKAGYAGNLSFGRAPVCVLRLGDFFRTRIIINSLQIQYETNQWDLNPEGVGVQPMLANVTLSFVFQGGSSLAGPIQRLQNAVSFNYYANQEVYDNRSDMAVYSEADNGGTGELDTSETMVWMPGMGSRTLGSISSRQESITRETSKKTDESSMTSAGQNMGKNTVDDAASSSIANDEQIKAKQKQEQDKKQGTAVIESRFA